MASGNLVARKFEIKLFAIHSMGGMLLAYISHIFLVSLSWSTVLAAGPSYLLTAVVNDRN